MPDDYTALARWRFRPVRTQASRIRWC